MRGCHWKGVQGALLHQAQLYTGCRVQGWTTAPGLGEGTGGMAAEKSAVAVRAGGASAATPGPVGSVFGQAGAGLPWTWAERWALAAEKHAAAGPRPAVSAVSCGGHCRHTLSSGSQVGGRGQI